jgi:3-oxoacyl-[acyl-carrier protein] reductase
MNLGIQNLNFIITGASRGIGRAIAESLLIEEANVGLVSRGQAQLDQTVDELRQQYGVERVVGWSTDCADEVALLELRQQRTLRWKVLDGVIANVGDGRSVKDAIPEAEQWSKVWHTNFDEGFCRARSNQLSNQRSNQLSRQLHSTDGTRG